VALLCISSPPACVGCRASRFDRSCLSACAWCGSRSSAPRARTHPGCPAGWPGAAPEFPSPLHERARVCFCMRWLRPTAAARRCLSPHSLLFNCVRSWWDWNRESHQFTALCCARRRRRGGRLQRDSSQRGIRWFVRSFVRTTGDLMAQEEIKVLHVGVAGLASFVVSSATSLPGSPAAAALRFAPAGAAPTHAAGTFVL
jgi:hypothetical protein